MKKSTLSSFILVLILNAIGSIACGATIANTSLWYGPILRKHFPVKIPFHGSDYNIGKLPCLPGDITRFSLDAGITSMIGGAFQVSGSVSLGKINQPFWVLDGAKGKKYMLHLHAYLFSPSGKLVWQQKGFPSGDSWMSAIGDAATFTLSNTYNGSTSGYELIVIAAGDPIFSDYEETRVVLGIKRMVLP